MDHLSRLQSLTTSGSHNVAYLGRILSSVHIRTKLRQSFGHGKTGLVLVAGSLAALAV